MISHIDLKHTSFHSLTEIIIKIKTEGAVSLRGEYVGLYQFRCYNYALIPGLN